MLSVVVQSGIQVLMWAGDADWICNWIGNFNAANMLDWAGNGSFAPKAAAPYTVGGKKYGEFKNVDNLSWLRVFDAGHEV
jgi:carboxypeptidase C (cathepsin A)